MAFNRRLVAVLAVAGTLFTVPAFGQDYFFPYYGKNKVAYEAFPWKSYASPHFIVYFYEDNIRILKAVVEMAESAYGKVSRELKHELNDPVPLLFYTTFTDFEQSNVFDVSEGVMGVSEPTLHRIGIHGDMAPDELQSLILHELTHIFEFEILWGRPGGALASLAQPPLWTFEGLSEYLTGSWSPWSTLILRDAILNDRIPEFAESGELASRYPLPREPAYDFGHAIYEFMRDRFGENAVREFFTSLKAGSSLLGSREPLKNAFNLPPRQFAQEFKKYLRTRVTDYVLRENPEDYSLALGPEFPMNPYYFAFSHAVSPSGDLVATITFNARDADIDIVLLSTADGKIVKNITQGYTSRYESIKYEVDPTVGKSLAWSPDGDSLAFFARDGRKHSLFLMSALQGKILKRVPLPVDEPVSPSFTPDGRKVLFVAFQNGVRDIFLVDLASGAVDNLSRDDLYEKAPVLSPDGTAVVYSVRVDGFDKLFLSPLADLRKKRQLTFGPNNTVTPEYAPDGRTVYFAGDARGAYNVYALDLGTGELRRFTDVRTGNFFPAALPGERRRLLFSAFNKGAFQLFKSEATGVVEDRVTFVDLGPEASITTFTPDVTVAIDPAAIKTVQGVGKLSVAARPPVDIGVGTDGSILGGSAIAFSDVLGDHQFSVAAYQVQQFRSIFLGYINQKRRLQWGISAYQYTLYYYPDFYYYEPQIWNYTTTLDALATRGITGVTLSAFYPFRKTLRAEAQLAYTHYEEDILDPTAYGLSSMLSYSYFLNGDMVTAAFSLTGETTRFKAFGPVAGNTFRLAVTQALPVAASFLQNTTLEADARQYLPLGGDILLALRLRGFESLGRNRFLEFYGGNNTVRSVGFYGLAGTAFWFANVECRFPLITAASTILGQIGPVRGVLFFDVTRIKYGDAPARLYVPDPATGDYVLREAIGSYGYGIELFLFGFPFHVEWVRRLEWSSFSQPFKFSPAGSFQTVLWIGFDF